LTWRGVLFLHGVDRNCVLESHTALAQLLELLAGETHRLAIAWDT
jgi:hypothetical protein